MEYLVVEKSPLGYRSIGIYVDFSKASNLCKILKKDRLMKKRFLIDFYVVPLDIELECSYKI